MNKPWTYERWNTEDLKEHFVEGPTFTKEEKQRIRKKVVETMKLFWEEVHEEMKSMSMDQVLKALKTMGKHPHFPTFVQNLTLLPNEGENDDSQPDLALKKDLFSWMTWLKLMESDDEEVKAYVRRYEIQIKIPDSDVKEEQGLARVQGSLERLGEAIGRSERREQESREAQEKLKAEADVLIAGANARDLESEKDEKEAPEDKKKDEKEAPKDQKDEKEAPEDKKDEKEAPEDQKNEKQDAKEAPKDQKDEKKDEKEAPKDQKDEKKDEKERSKDGEHPKIRRMRRRMRRKGPKIRRRRRTQRSEG